MFRRAPVKKLSTQMTSQPSASSRSHRCEPRKPAPPVTSTRLRSASLIRVRAPSPNSGDFGEGVVPVGDEALDIEARERGAPRLAAEVGGELAIGEQRLHPFD